MTTEIIIAILWIIGSIIVASLTFSFNKKKEREAEWRKEKLKFYIEFIESLSWITDFEWSYENDIRFAKACNDLYLFAPNNVLWALKEFQNHIRISNESKSYEIYMKTLSELILKIRNDIGIKWEDGGNFNVNLWTSGRKKPIEK